MNNKFFEDNCTSKGKFGHNDKEYDYYVLNKSFAPNLPYFAGFPDEALIISEDVPVEFHEHIFSHEIGCNKDPIRNECCIRATRKEIESVPISAKMNTLKFEQHFMKHY